jgi:hypothetical protein
MIINSKNCSMQMAVATFFGVACMGGLSGMFPWTCSKRALISAFIVYGMCRCAIKVINKIILSALVRSQMNKQEDSASGNQE